MLIVLRDTEGSLGSCHGAASPPGHHRTAQEKEQGTLWDRNLHAHSCRQRALRVRFQALLIKRDWLLTGAARDQYQQGGWVVGSQCSALCPEGRGCFLGCVHRTECQRPQ